MTADIFELFELIGYRASPVARTRLWSNSRSHRT